MGYWLKLHKPLGPPIQFSIEATNRCNFRCVFCPQSNPEHKNRRPVGELTIENFRVFLEKVKKVKSGNSKLSICLDGEPLMNRSFVEFVKLANEAGFCARFSSNGRLFLPAVTDALMKNLFIASIDFASEAAAFETMRGRIGDFEIVLDNLRYLVKRASENRNIGVEIVDVTHFDGHVAPEESLRSMRQMFPSELPRNIRFWSRQFHNFGGHLGAGVKGGYRLCPYPWVAFNVAWNGDVVACCRDTEGKTVLGNVFREDILTIWRGKAFVEMRKALIEQRPQDVVACRGCDMPFSADGARWRIGYLLSSLLRR